MSEKNNLDPIANIAIIEAAQQRVRTYFNIVGFDNETPQIHTDVQWTIMNGILPSARHVCHHLLEGGGDEYDYEEFVFSGPHVGAEYTAFAVGDGMLILSNSKKV